MVEEDCGTHVVVASPPSLFDAAVILRTLYTGLGASGWCATIIGLGRRIPSRLVLESRVPVSVILGNVRLQAPGQIAEPAYIVDNRGVAAAELDAPATLVVDYSGMLEKAWSGLQRVSGAGFPSLTYEAVVTIYEFFIRERSAAPSLEPRSSDVRKGLYIARKALEALRFYDNYPLLEPNTILYALRRVYMSEGFIVDPRDYSIKINPVDGSVREVIEGQAYSRRGLRHVGRVTLVFDGYTLRVSDWRGEKYVVTVDPETGTACIAAGFCVEREAGRLEEANIPEMV